MIRLVSHGDRRYVSDDGRVVVDYQDGFVTYCDAPHPVRVLASTFDTWADHYKRSLDATRKGKYVTWLCPGFAEHTYSQWCVQIDGDWTEHVYDTFGEALATVEAQTGEPVKVVRQRKPKPAKVDVVVADGEHARRVFEDELRAARAFIDDFGRHLQDPDLAPFLDTELLAYNQKRVVELESVLQPSGSVLIY